MGQSTDCVTGTEPSATDLDLVRLAQAGNVEAFGELVERNRRAVFRAALACVGFVAYGLFRAAGRLFGWSRPKAEPPVVRDLPRADPYYEAAMRELDSELGHPIH